jgi:predicted GNAT family N-acyltransferase
MNAPLKHAEIFRLPEPQPRALEVSIARTLNELMEVMAIRTLVYVGEQTCPFDEEYDGNDFCGATHLLLRSGSEPIGALRLRWFADFVKLERVAVRREHRGGPGTLALVRAAFALAERKGYSVMLGHAQLRLVPFWRRHFGFEPRAGRPGFTFSDHDYVEIEAQIRPSEDAISINADPLVLLRPEGEWHFPGVLDRSAARTATNPGV